MSSNTQRIGANNHSNSYVLHLDIDICQLQQSAEDCIGLSSKQENNESYPLKVKDEA